MHYLKYLCFKDVCKCILGMKHCEPSEHDEELNKLINVDFIQSYQFDTCDDCISNNKLNMRKYDECMICLEELCREECILIHCCKSILHKKCFSLWCTREKNVKCPICYTHVLSI